MTGTIFHIVDVFAQEKYAGNQLAVILDAVDIPDATMLRLAKEMNYSETTFILSDTQREGGFDVRIFTPGGEIPFAGHPTLGTAYIIQREILQGQGDSVTLNLKVGPVPVSFSAEGNGRELLWMRQNPAEFQESFDPKEMAALLNLKPDLVDGRFPVQTVSTGFPAVIVPLKTLEAVRAARINRDLYFRFVENREAKAILVFAPETYNPDNHLNVRVFVDYFGIPEDPATGSANGCLAGFLAKHRYFGDAGVDIRVEQGYEIGRPSLLYLKAEDKNGRVDVHVGGQVIPVARGELV